LVCSSQLQNIPEGTSVAIAMLALVALELVPEALRRGRRRLGVAGLACGAALMWAVSIALNV
jgi:zinc transporter ZupT